MEPMLLLRTDTLPAGKNWVYELKLDGYRAIALKSGGRVQLRSRNDNDFSAKYRAITEALSNLPDETVVDGELVALDESGRPSFNALQNHGSSKAPLLYYIFDLVVLSGKDLRGQPLEDRRARLQHNVLSKLAEPIRFSPDLDADLPTLIASVKQQGLEGLVAKRRDSFYEPGQRSGAWQKMRINQDRNSSSADILSGAEASMLWSSATTRERNWSMPRERGTASHQKCARSCSGGLLDWK